MLQCFKLTFEFELNTLYLNHTAEMKTHTHERRGGGVKHAVVKSDWGPNKSTGNGLMQVRTSL